MPKKGNTRDLPNELRGVLSANLEELIERYQVTNTDIEKASGIDRTTVGRIRRREIATNLDTLQAISAAFGVDPWMLLDPRRISGVTAKLLSIKPVPDERLGSAWTRPDRQRPLLDSRRDREKYSARRTKIKIK